MVHHILEQWVFFDNLFKICRGLRRGHNKPLKFWHNINLKGFGKLFSTFVFGDDCQIVKRFFRIIWRCFEGQLTRTRIKRKHIRIFTRQSICKSNLRSLIAIYGRQLSHHERALIWAHQTITRESYSFRCSIRHCGFNGRQIFKRNLARLSFLPGNSHIFNLIS